MEVRHDLFYIYFCAITRIFTTLLNTVFPLISAGPLISTALMNAVLIRIGTIF